MTATAGTDLIFYFYNNFYIKLIIRKMILSYKILFFEKYKLFSNFYFMLKFFSPFKAKAY